MIRRVLIVVIMLMTYILVLNANRIFTGVGS